ncbi:MAG: serine hydrolase domain-containing protein [Acidimicrobiales bacterium]
MDLLSPIHQWPVDRVAAAVVLPDGRIDTDGDLDTRFEWASLTKPLVAVAALVAVEDESIDLDEPAGPPGSTVRHLLAHASGLDTDTDEVLADPGTRRIYSNTGYEQLRLLLETRTGLGIDAYVAEAVLAPLDMSSTTLAGRAHTGATGTIGDLARFAAELMAPTSTLLAPATRELLTTVAFAGLEGVLPGFGVQPHNDWGLGLELADDKHPHWSPTEASPDTFGHFGRAGSLLWVDPEVPVALAVLGDRPFDSWAPPLWRELGSAVITEARA